MLTHVWVDSVHPTCWTTTNNSEGISHIFGCIAKISHLWFNLCMCNPTMEKNSLWLIGESWKSLKIWILLWTCSIVYFGTHDNQKIAHLQIHTDKKNVAIAMVGNFFFSGQRSSNSRSLLPPLLCGRHSTQHLPNKRGSVPRLLRRCWAPPLGFCWMGDS
jgi:hypothetical protein